MLFPPSQKIKNISSVFAGHRPVYNAKQLIHLKTVVYKIFQSRTGDHGLDVVNSRQKMILPLPVQL